MRRGTCLDDGLLRGDGVEEDARHGGGRAALGGRRGDGVRDGFRKEGERDSSVDAARVRPTHRWRARAVWARGNSRGEGPDAGVHQGCRVARAAALLCLLFSPLGRRFLRLSATPSSHLVPLLRPARTPSAHLLQSRRSHKDRHSLPTSRLHPCHHISQCACPSEA